MTFKELIDFYGTQAVAAKALGITPPAVNQWRGGIPKFRQLQIQRITRGKLKADDNVFDKAA